MIVRFAKSTSWGWSSSDASIPSFSVCVLICAQCGLMRDATSLIGERKCKLLGKQALHATVCFHNWKKNVQF